MAFDMHDGDDTIRGGSANDYLDAGEDADTIGGGAGRDTTSYFRFGGSEDTVVTIGSGTGNDGSVDDGPANGRDTVEEDVENVIGGSKDDTLTGNARANRLIGREGADSLQGLGGGDVLKAKDGIADLLIDCGAGSGDRARFDLGLDPTPLSC